MRVSIDEDLCEGHARCQAAAPEVFEVREDLSYIKPGMEEVPEDLKAKVLRAARLCPRQAVILEGA
jgi:ferredoxin